MHWLPRKVQPQPLSNRRHLFPGFLLVADRLAGLSFFCPRTSTSDLDRRNRGYFTTCFSKLLGLLGIWSWAGAQELVEIWLSAFFWRNQGVPNVGFWTSVAVRSISESILPTSTEKERAGNSAGKFPGSAASSLCFSPSPFLDAAACSTMRTGWRGCCSYSSIQHTGRTVQRPGAKGLQKHLAGWADLIELTLPSFTALTFAEGWHLLLPVLPLCGEMLQSSWTGAPCAGHGLGEGKEDVVGVWDFTANKKGHGGWQQWICSVRLLLQVRLEVTWPVTVPERQSRSFVLLPLDSNQPPALFFKRMSQDSKDL